MIQEFRDFSFRGNVVDLAVGIVIGAAFTAIVSSRVSDLLTPIIGILFCPACASEIPIAARRCPMCTSELA